MGAASTWARPVHNLSRSLGVKTRYGEPARMEDLGQLGALSANVWTRADASGAVASSTVTARLRDGRWQRVLIGAYTDGGHDPDALQHAWAAVLTSAHTATACARTAARLWGVPLIDDADPLAERLDARNHDVAVDRHVRAIRRGDGHVVHQRQLVLLPDEVVEHPSGLVVTTPGRTLRDLACVVAPEALQVAVDHSLRTGLVDDDSLAGVLARAKGTRHVRALQVAFERADAGAQSPAETLARIALLPSFPRLRAQVPVHSETGELIAVLDLAVEELMLAIEVDGRRNHAGQQMVAKDRARDRRTEERGWHTERVTWFELRRRRAAFVARVRSVAARLELAAS